MWPGQLKSSFAEKCFEVGVEVGPAFAEKCFESSYQTDRHPHSVTEMSDGGRGTRTKRDHDASAAVMRRPSLAK